MKTQRANSSQSLIAEADDLSAKGKFSASNRVLKEMLAGNRIAGNKVVLAEVSFKIAVNSYHLHHDADALLNFSEAFLLFKELEMYDRLALVANNIGSLYKKKGNYKKSLAQFLEGIFLAFQNNDQRAMVASSIGVGIVLDELNDFERSVRAYDAAYSFCEINKGSYQFDLLKCHVLVNKANAYARRGKLKEALNLLTEAQPLSKQFPQTTIPDTVEANLAGILIDMGEYDKAYAILKKFESAVKQISDEITAAVSLNLGRVYNYKFKDEKKFLASVEKAMAIYTKKQKLTGLIEGHKILYEHYLDENIKTADKHKKIIENLRKKEEEFKEIDHLSNMVEAELFAIESKLQSDKKFKKFLSLSEFLTSYYEYKSKKINYRIPLRDIAYCEVKGNYLFIYTATGQSTDNAAIEEFCKIRKPIKDFIHEISKASDYFVRIHSSFIVNLYRVSRNPKQNFNQIRIGDKMLRISDNYRADYRKKLGEFVAMSGK